MLDEAKNTQCAREMADRGDWIVPTFNEQLRTDKPPLHYFFMRISYSIFSDGAFGGRFFSAVFGSFTVLLTFLYANTFGNEKIANFSAFTLLTSLGFVTQFHLAVPDPYLIFFIAASLISYFYYEQEYGRKFLYMAYVAIGLGVLTKGPIAIVLPGMGIFFYMLYKRKLNLRSILMLNPPLGILIILVIAAPWYYLVHIQTDGAWTEGFFLDHNINRFNSPKEGHGGQFWLPIVYAFGMLLPMAVFLPNAIIKLLKEKNDLVVFCLITFICMIVFFSIASTKLPGYTSPIFPFAAIMIGSYLSQIDSSSKKGVWISTALFFVIAFGLFFGSKIGIENTKEIKQLIHLQWYFLPLPIAAFVAVYLVIRNHFQDAAITLGLSFLIMHQLFFYFVFPEINNQNPVVKTQHLIENEEYIIGFQRVNAGYIHALDRPISTLFRTEDLMKFVKGKESVTILTRPEYLERLSDLTYTEVAREPDLFDGSTTVIIKIKN